MIVFFVGGIMEYSFYYILVRVIFRVIILGG